MDLTNVLVILGIIALVLVIIALLIWLVRRH